MHVEHQVGLTSFTAQLETFLSALDQLGDDGFWATTRCRGWCAGDVMVHVHLGLQEMLLGVVSPTSSAADTDAASYWAGSVAGAEDAAPELHQLHFVRLLTAAYRQPRNLRSQLRTTAAALIRGVQALPEGRVSFQNRVLATGDFLATWAVELAIHHLDLSRELTLDPPHPAALTLARQTIETLAAPFPEGWSDERVVLLGTGRVTPQGQERTELADLTDRLPVFS